MGEFCLRNFQLKDRKKDIPWLVKHYVEGCDPKIDIADSSMKLLCEYSWPGSIFELKSTIYYACQICKYKIMPADLPKWMQKKKFIAPEGQSLDAAEQTHIWKVYNDCGKNKIHSAQTLGIAVNTLRRKLHEYGWE